MEQTTNYNLNLPAYDDLADIEKINENTRIIDTNLKQVADKAAAALPATSYTAADILNKLKTVDGVNSGLDADLFKGQSVIPVANGGTGATTVDTARENLNAFRRYAYYTSGGATNVDTDMFDFALVAATHEFNTALYNVVGGTFVYVWQFYTNTGTGATSRRVQLAHNMGANKMATRYYNGGWSDWAEIPTSENFSSMVQSALQSGGVSVIKSIQRGSTVLSTDTAERTVTISAVNMDKAILIYTGMSTSNNSLTYYPQISLTGPTEITVKRYSGSGNYSTVIPYQVIEFY